MEAKKPTYQNSHHNQIKIPIEGMDCSDCAIVVEHGLSRLQGVLNVTVSYTAQIAQIDYDSQQTSQRAIEKRVRQLGYLVPEGSIWQRYHKNRELIFSLSAGAALLAGWTFNHLLGLPPQLSMAFYLIAYVLAGFDPARHAIGAIRHREFDTDLLMIIAAIGAAWIGDFAEGALLLFLFSLGHAIEERTLDRTRNAIRSLAELTPKVAQVRRENREVEIPVENLILGDLVIVRPGARIPVDGEVTAGESSVDQSPVTGESMPVEKSKSDRVFAGSINGQGVIEVRVNRLARDSTLARVAEMVVQAQAQKSPTQRTTEKFISIFIPVILIGDLLVILIPPLFGVPFATSFLRAMSLLVAVSPCALALGTPAAILSGVAQAARNGVLIKGGTHLETLGEIKAIAFDKTGTITRGIPELTDIYPLSKIDTAELVAFAAALESHSNHPLAKAVLRAAQNQGLPLPQATQAHAANGLGVEAIVNGEPGWVGNARFLQQNGLEQLPTEIETKAQIYQEQGKTVIFVGKNHTLLGLVAVSDVIRKDFSTILAELRKLGIQKFVMLTGDHSRAAAHISRLAGLKDYRAGLLPEDKLAAIRELSEQHRPIAMVGDGVNDAPALAFSDVGIAMGGAGTDAALETADVALMADDLSKLPFTVGLGRATRRIILENLWISLGVIVALAFLTLTGLSSIGAAVLIHEGSTILVVLNALRLLQYKG